MNLTNKIYVGVTFGLAITGAVILGASYIQGGTILINTNHYGEGFIEWLISTVWLGVTLSKLIIIIIYPKKRFLE